jgi:hypothetical protein
LDAVGLFSERRPSHSETIGRLIQAGLNGASESHNERSECPVVAVGATESGTNYEKVDLSCRVSLNRFTVKTNRTLVRSYGIKAHVDSTQARAACPQLSSDSYSCRKCVRAHQLVVTTFESTQPWPPPRFKAVVAVDGQTSSALGRCA